MDYERPRTHENNMLIDLLAPDNHQNWRGTLRHNHLKMWTEKHDAMENRYKAVMNNCQYQRSRAEALAFSKEPFPPQHVFEQEQQGKMKMAANTHRSAPELSRPNTSSSLASSSALRPMSRAGTVASDDVRAGIDRNPHHLSESLACLLGRAPSFFLSSQLLSALPFHHVVYRQKMRCGGC